MGMFLVLLGAILFFSEGLFGYNLKGFLITLLSGIGWASYMVAGKFLFKKIKISPLGNTAFAMGFGTILLSFTAFFLEGLSVISFSGWVIIVWLGVVNTAAAFFLWNHVLDRIDAFELSILQNTMLLQITFLSIVFLGERYSLDKYLVMGLIFLGVLIVQLKSK